MSRVQGESGVQNGQAPVASVAEFMGGELITTRAVTCEVEINLLSNVIVPISWCDTDTDRRRSATQSM